MKQDVTLKPTPGQDPHTTYGTEATVLEPDSSVLVTGDFVAFCDDQGNRFVIDGMTIAALRR